MQIKLSVAAFFGLLSSAFASTTVAEATPIAKVTYFDNKHCNSTNQESVNTKLDFACANFKYRAGSFHLEHVPRRCRMVTYSREDCKEEAAYIPRGGLGPGYCYSTAVVPGRGDKFARSVRFYCKKSFDVR